MLKLLLCLSLVLCCSLLVKGQEDCPDDMFDYYKFLGVEHKATPSSISSISRKMLAKFHPDICKKAGCKESFIRVNIVKATLIDAKKRDGYDKCLARWLDNPRLFDPKREAPATSFLLVLLIVITVTGGLQYMIIKNKRTAIMKKEEENLVRRNKYSTELMFEIAKELNLDTKFGLFWELWVWQVIQYGPGWIHGVIVAQDEPEKKGRKKLSPQDAATKSLVAQLLQIAVMLMFLYVGWVMAQRISGARMPFYAVMSGSMEPGISRGDLVFATWGKQVIDNLKVGDIVIFYIWQEDNEVTLHRITELHVHTIPGGDVWMMTKGDNNTKSDRNLFASKGGQLLWEDDEPKFFGTRYSASGKIVYKIPFAGYIFVVFSENPVIIYILLGLVVCILAYETLDEARKAKRALKPKLKNTSSSSSKKKKRQ